MLWIFGLICLSVVKWVCFLLRVVCIFFSDFVWSVLSLVCVMFCVLVIIGWMVFCNVLVNLFVVWWLIVDNCWLKVLKVILLVKLLLFLFNKIWIGVGGKKWLIWSVLGVIVLVMKMSLIKKVLVGSFLFFSNVIEVVLKLLL